MTRETSHETVSPLLPWYANGTIGESDRELVERHLPTCDECREELAFLQGVDETTSELAAGLPVPDVGAALAKTMTEIDEWERARSHAPMGRLAAFFDALWNPQPLLARAVLAAGLVLALAGGWLVLSQPREPQFTTLSGGPASTAGGPLVSVVFQPSITEETLRRTLLDAGATVVSGPSVTGVFVVKLALDPNDSRAVDSAIDKLRANTSVIRFAERQP